MDKLMNGLITGDISPETALLSVALIADRAEREARKCVECGNVLHADETKGYKNSPVCDECYVRIVEEAERDE